MKTNNLVFISQLFCLILVFVLAFSVATGFAADDGGHGGGHDEGHSENPVSIDWAALVSQIVAFLILLWVMKAFMFGPIGRILEERRSNIQTQLEQIDQDRQDMTRLKGEYESRLSDIEAEARKKIQEAINRGNELGEHVQEEARKKADQMLQKAHEALEYEKNRATLEMRTQITELALDMASRLIHKELNPELHKELIDKFINEVEEKVAHEGNV